MSVTVKPRSLDVDVLIDGAVAALIANATVATLTAIPNTTPTEYAIYSEIAPQGSTGAYVIVALPSTVYASTYQGPTLSTLLDVSAYTQGDSTTTVRALITACLAALIDAPWSIAGMTMIAANMEEAGSGFRSLTEVVNGQILRGRQITVRVIALRV